MMRAVAVQGRRIGQAVAQKRMIRPVFLPAATAANAIRSMSSQVDQAGGTILSNMAADNPHVDVVRYHHKNRTWTLQHVNYYAEALAIGLLENGLKPGDAVLSWLPSHLSEQMVLQFACSKSGLILYSLDPSLATSDPEAAKTALAAALEVTKANVLISQEAGSDVNYIRLAESVVPELTYFDYTSGMPFVTPRFPDLRLCIQTGFDQEDKWGWLRYRHMIVPAGNLDQVEPATLNLNGETPLAGELKLDANSIPVSIGQTLTNKQVLQKKLWSTFSSILEKKYHEVEGVGVIF